MNISQLLIPMIVLRWDRLQQIQKAHILWVAKNFQAVAYLFCHGLGLYFLTTHSHIGGEPDYKCMLNKTESEFLTWAFSILWTSRFLPSSGVLNKEFCYSNLNVDPSPHVHWVSSWCIHVVSFFPGLPLFCCSSASVNEAKIAVFFHTSLSSLVQPVGSF